MSLVEVNKLIGNLTVNRPPYPSFRADLPKHLPPGLDPKETQAVQDCAKSSETLADFSTCIEGKLKPPQPPQKP